MKVKQIKTRKELLRICSEYKFDNTLDLLKMKYDVYDPETGSLHPFYYVFSDNEPCGILVLNSRKTHYKGYLQILLTEVSEEQKGEGITKYMIDWISEKAKEQGWKGLSLQTINPVNKKWMEDDNWDYPEDLKFDDEKEIGDTIVELYKKLGFKPVSYTSWKGLNMKKELNEGYNSMSLGIGQNYHSSADGLYFEYRLLPLTNNLGQRGYKTYTKAELDTFDIKKGDYVSGVSPVDEKRHYGVIQRFFIPEGSTEIEWVFILDRDTSEIMAVYPDTVKIAYRTGKPVTEALLTWDNNYSEEPEGILNANEISSNMVDPEEEYKKFNRKKDATIGAFMISECGWEDGCLAQKISWSSEMFKGKTCDLRYKKKALNEYLPHVYDLEIYIVNAFLHKIHIDKILNEYCDFYSQWTLEKKTENIQIASYNRNPSIKVVVGFPSKDIEDENIYLDYTI